MLIRGTGARGYTTFMKYVDAKYSTNKTSLVNSHINRSGEITSPLTLTITTRNLITVLPINDVIILPITEMPELRQYPKEYARGT
jgi:hypothetical protein